MCVCVCVFKSLCCIPEINYIPIKQEISFYLISNTLVSVYREQKKIGLTNWERYYFHRCFPGGVLVVKNPPSNAGGIIDAGSIPGSERSLGEEMATHSSILAWRIAMDKGVCWATVHRVAQRWIWLKQPSTHTLQNEGKMCRKPCLSVISTTGKNIDVLLR